MSRDPCDDGFVCGGRLPAPPVVGVVDPVVVGVWAAAGAFVGGVFGTVTTVVATGRLQVEVELFERMRRRER